MVINILYTHDAIGPNVPKLYRAYYSSKADYLTVNRWCKENCKGKFYFSPAYLRNSVQFENDEDMIWFALKWS